MRHHRRAILITGVTAAFAHMAPAQSTNGGGVGGDSLNIPGSRSIQRLLDTDYQVHLLAPVTVEGRTGWCCVALNE